METQHSQRKMQPGKYIIDFIVILAIAVALVCLSFFYAHVVKNIKAMEKDPKVIEYNQLRKKHFNLN
jgi:hypothetical protein